MLGAGGPDTGLSFLYMAFGGGRGWREILADGICGKARSCQEVFVIDGIDPCGRWRAECALMEELDKLCFRGGLVGIVGGVG